MSRLISCRFLLAAGLLLSACRYEPIHWQLRDAGVEGRAPDPARAPPATDAGPVPDADPTADALGPVPDDAATDAIAMPMPMPAPDAAPMPGPMPDAAPRPMPDAMPRPMPDAAPAIVCGNGVVERGETCEPVAECNRRQAMCLSDANTIRTGSGSAAACTFVCSQSPRACGPADGQCPAGCAKDPNCLPRPEDCTGIEWCVKPFQPNQGSVICQTAKDARCTDAERIAECAREAARVCGAGHRKPIQYVPPIGGRTSG